MSGIVCIGAEVSRQQDEDVCGEERESKGCLGTGPGQCGFGDYSWGDERCQGEDETMRML